MQGHPLWDDSIISGALLEIMAVLQQRLSTTDWGESHYMRVMSSWLFIKIQCVVTLIRRAWSNEEMLSNFCLWSFGHFQEVRQLQPPSPVFQFLRREITNGWPYLYLLWSLWAYNQVMTTYQPITFYGSQKDLQTFSPKLRQSLKSTFISTWTLSTKPDKR